MEALVGDRPVVGYLTSRTLVEDGGAWWWCGGDVRAETELGIELGRGLGAGATPSEAAAAIAGLCTALEIVDVARPAGDLEAVMRGNVFHRAVAFGRTRAVRARDLGRASLRLDGEVHEAAEPIPDPVWVVRTVAQVLGEFGEALVAGDRVLSGSFVHERLGHARAATAEVDTLGQVSLRVSRRHPGGPEARRSGA